MALVFDIFINVTCYSLVLFSLLGLGSMGNYVDYSDDPLLRTGIGLIIGLFFTALISMAAHFLTALDLTFTILLLSFGLVLFWLKKEKILLSFPWKIFFSMVLFFCYVAYLSPGHGDTPLYHWQAVKWIFSEKIVIGLVNLHSRFGFNSGWWLILAALNPLKSLEFCSFLSTLPYFACSMLLAFFYKYFRVELLLTLIFFAILSSDFIELNMGCVATDGPAFGVVAAIFLVIAYWDSSEKLKNYFWILPSLALLISIKPSMMVMSLVLLILFFKKNLKEIVQYSWLPLIYLFLFSVRGFLTSGYPLYPLHIPKSQWVSWAATNQMIQEEMISITGWARNGGENFKQSVTNWDWLPSWFAVNGNRTFIEFFVGIILLFILFRKKIPLRNQLLSSVCILGLMVWFTSAPDTRFGLGYIYGLWLLVLSPLVVELNKKHLAIWKRLQLYCGLWFFCGLCIHFVPRWAEYDKKWKINSLSTERDFYRVGEDGFCGDAELPCAAQVNDKLTVQQWHGYKMFFQK